MYISVFDSIKIVKSVKKLTNQLVQYLNIVLTTEEQPTVSMSGSTRKFPGVLIRWYRWIGINQHADIYGIYSTVFEYVIHAL